MVQWEAMRRESIHPRHVSRMPIYQQEPSISHATGSTLMGQNILANHNAKPTVLATDYLSSKQNISSGKTIFDIWTTNNEKPTNLDWNVNLDGTDNGGAPDGPVAPIYVSQVAHASS